MTRSTVRLAPAALITVAALAAELVACVNVYHTDIHGHSKVTSDIGGYEQRITSTGMDEDYWSQKKSELEPQLDDGDFTIRSDYAVALLHLGEVPCAVEILEELEREHPDEYIIAANLGTAYELSGEDEKALRFIKKGIELNRTSHDRTEWLHVKILETKLQLAQDSKWLETNSVLGVDFGNEAEPKLPTGRVRDDEGSPLELEAVRRGLTYQLSERLQFVKPPDAIVAELIFDLANVVAVTETVEEAIPVYELAEKYGVEDTKLLALRVKRMREIVASNPLSGEHAGESFDIVATIVVLFGVFLVVGVLACGCLFIFRRRRRWIEYSKTDPDEEK